MHTTKIHTSTQTHPTHLCLNCLHKLVQLSISSHSTSTQHRTNVVRLLLLLSSGNCCRRSRRLAAPSLPASTGSSSGSGLSRPIGCLSSSAASGKSRLSNGLAELLVNADRGARHG